MKQKTNFYNPKEDYYKKSIDTPFRSLFLKGPFAPHVSLSSFAGRPLAISSCPDLEDHNFGS